MNLYMVHVGYYDPDLGYGIYEFHTNFFVVAEDERAAKKKVLAKPKFKEKQMHIDGILQLSCVDGYDIELKKSASEADQIKSIGYSESKALG